VKARQARDPLVRGSDVAKTYGHGEQALVAVHGVTVAVWPGDRIAISGRSGSGKSTLLHLLAGLERPTSGTVEWPGLGSVAPHPPDRIGVVFQGPSLLPPLDVVENVALPLVLAGEPDAVARERAVESLARLDIAELAGQLPEELSGGQAQRVAVARVLAAGAPLILADEPTGQLDSVAADHVVDVLLAAADALGAALVVATHDERVAGRFATRWMMRDGTLGTARLAGVPGGTS
jgi:putative ABC transport system ATP-binding protein